MTTHKWHERLRLILLDLTALPPCRWGPVNTVLTVAVLILLGAGYYLLSEGKPHGQTDQIGVIVTIVNLFILDYALRGWHKAE